MRIFGSQPDTKLSQSDLRTKHSRYIPQLITIEQSQEAAATGLFGENNGEGFSPIVIITYDCPL